MHRHLIQRRSIWFPTRLGCLILLAFVGAPFGLWCFFGESFLAHTERVPADVLVIEGWVGIEGVQAAKLELEQHTYRYVVVTGGVTDSRWSQRRWNYAVEAGKLLRHLGVPPGKVIEAPAMESANRRTFESALAVREALAKRSLQPNGVNVFTLGVHAKRSRLVFAKALSGTEVGAIAWRPPDYRPEPWWNSSERAVDFLKETVGWLFELLLNSGRLSNAPVDLNTKPTK